MKDSNVKITTEHNGKQIDITDKIMGATKTKTERKFLTCKLSNDEIREMGEELADLNQQEKKLKAELKSYQSQKKSEIDINSEQISIIADQIRTGEVERHVEVSIEFNVPKENMKTITRADTGESWKESMTESDFDQMELFEGTEQF